MTRIIRLTFAILSLAALLLVSAGLSDAGGKKSDSKVKITTDASKPDTSGKQTIIVNIAIEDGWYIYANPVGNKDFEANRTTITAIAGKKELDAKADFPAGKTKSIGDISYNAYTDKVAIPVQITRPAGEEVTLHIRLSACNTKGVCLLPATVKISVP